MKKHKFTIVFSSLVKPVVSTAKDEFLATASLEYIKQFIPNVNPEVNYDLLPISFNACVINRVNKNGHVIDTNTALAIYDTFINKPINIEHDRQKVIGVILTAGFSEFGTDKPLSRKDVEGMTGPFNITLGGVLWRAVNSGVTNLVEDAADPTSESYLTISASWELGYTDFDVVLIEGDSKNLKDGTIISDKKEIAAVASKLQIYGGDGKLDKDKHVYCKMTEDVLALGIGLTESPAAEVKGIATASVEIVTEQLAEVDSELEKASKDLTQGITNSLLSERNSEKNNEVISQAENDTVKDNSKISNMKITSLKDITEDFLKQANASTVIRDFIEEQITEADKKFNAEKAEREKAEAAQKNVVSELEKAKAELVKIQETLEEIRKANAEREAQEVFSNRMSSFDNAYDLTDEDRTVIASQIKGLTAEVFAEYEKQIAILMKEKNKEVKKKAAEAAEKAALEAKASTTENTEKVVEKAIDESKKTTTVVPATTQAGAPSLKEKYAAAFAPENFVIKK